jgi:hypothetical protein
MDTTVVTDTGMVTDTGTGTDTGMGMDIADMDTGTGVITIIAAMATSLFKSSTIRVMATTEGEPLTVATNRVAIIAAV